MNSLFYEPTDAQLERFLEDWKDERYARGEL